MKKTIIITVIVVLLLSVLIYYIYIKPSKMFQQPVKGRISSKFGNRIHPVTKVSSFHNGVDIAAPTGTPIGAPMDGEILKIYEGGPGGKQMIVIHDGGWVTGYAHLSGYNKKVGDKVKQHEIIAFVGNTGTSTGAHLHFTLTNPKGVKVDPESYFNKPLI